MFAQDKENNFMTGTVPEFIPSSENSDFENKENIFASELDCLFDKCPKESLQQIRRRINDFDSSLILENATKTVNNKSLKIELKISSTERELEKVQEQIGLLQMLNLDYDKDRLKELHSTKEILETQIEKLKTEYRQMGLIYHISDRMSDVLAKVRTEMPKDFLSTVSRAVCSKLPFLRKNCELSSEIQKLKTIQQRLSEKSKQRSTPYGEKDKEMNTFIDFWSKAKQLDAKIKKLVSK